MKEVIEQKTFSRSLTRRNFLSTSLKAGAAAFTTALLPNLSAKAQGQYNVLFIMVDDLRPLLGCYGHQEMHTPNVDRLAQRGTLFNRAYCQFPLCNPSRASILTGLRPDTTGVHDNYADFRETVPDAVTLPQHFKTHGYHTRSIGKIRHNTRTSEEIKNGVPPLQNDNSWSVPFWWPKWRAFGGVPSWQALNVNDDALEDGAIAKHTVGVLEDVKDSQFLLAVGFVRPHLPFHAPQKYFELYDTQIFDNVPRIVLHRWHELRNYSDIPVGDAPLTEKKTLELIRAYAASTSYMDAQVGRILNQLDALNLTENTVIVFAGDHGFHLGEHGLFGKRTIFDVSLHSPLIVSFPEQNAVGERTDALVELVDIYPTLCDLCNLPIPPELEGLSMVPVIEEPTRPWKTAAFSQLGNSRSIRTKQYRYTESGERKELYDYHIDPDGTINQVDLPENTELIAHLSQKLSAGWYRALPDMHNHPYVPPTQPYDINDDGIVDIQDLILISNDFGKMNLDDPKVDVNRDGRVDIIDLLIVASHFTESSNTAAPSKHTAILLKHVDRIEEWLAEAHTVKIDTDIYQRGITVLEALLSSVIPERTVLLPNYPNPFNPETWIPYDLANDTDVSIEIYNLKGESIRHLKVGFQTAGTYRTQTRAAHWDGRNAAGEPVASGIYFYTLHAGAGQAKATRKMIVTK